MDENEIQALFPDLPEDLGELSAEEVNERITTYQATADRLLNDEVEGLTLAERVDEMTRGAELIDLLRVNRDERAAADAELQTRLEEAAARAIPADEAPAEPEATEATEEPEAPAAEPVAAATDEPAAEPDTPAEPVAEPVAVVAEPAAEPEAIAAAAPPRPRRLPRRTGRAAEALPNQAAAITAAADVDGYPAGGPIQNLRGVAEAMISKHDRVGRVSGMSATVDVPIATIHGSYPADRDLRRMAQDPTSMMQMIDAVTSPQAITASGGLCAPVEPYYGLEMVSSAERPVRAALAGFQATRGGIQVAAVPTLASITDGVGIMTEANDAAGGTSAVKTCQVIDCPDFATVFVDAVYHCLQFGNLGARAWPEQVQNAIELTLAAHARTAETNLLDSIDAGSTQVTDAVSVAGVSGYTQVVGSFAKIAAGMRSRHRMALGTSIRVLAPAWLRELVISDLARSAFTADENAEALLNMELAALGINLSWYRDGKSGGGQVFGTQGAGAITDFPATAIYYAYPEGSWLYLDAGTLELGIVRDSTLNSTNDYQIFGETFENAALIGVESLKVSLSVCDTGAFSGTVAIPCAD